MRFLLLVLIPLLSFSAIAQKQGFVRVFDLQGRTIGSGHIVMVTDTSIQIQRGKGVTRELAVSKIGTIKTKRALRHNLAIGTLVGAPTLAIVVAASTSRESFSYSTPTSFIFGPSTPGQGALLGAIMGIPVGALVGGLTALFKKSKTFSIEGDTRKLQGFKSTLPPAIE